MDYSPLLEKFFAGKSFPKDRPIILTIIKIVPAEVGQDKSIKPVAYFLEDVRGFVINKTNYAKLAKAHGGSTDADSWIGATVELTYDPDVEFRGAAIGGIRLRVKTPAAAPAKA